MNENSSDANRVTYRKVSAEYAGQRIDNFLLGHLKGVPRSHVYRLVRSGQVRVNSGRVAPGYRLRDGDRIRIPPVRTSARGSGTSAKPALDWLEERIVYEDRLVMLIDKPAGMAVHGGTGVNLGCIEALRILRPGPSELELVHRIDKATSGCLLVAKRRSALRSLHRLLRENRIEKRYLALVRGNFGVETRSADQPLVVDRQGHGARARVDDVGRPATSRFRPLRHYGDRATFVEVEIETGRTHQIRAHAAHLGHPIAGDERYGDRDFDRFLANAGLGRMFLHACSLSFFWPEQDRHFGVCVPLPGDLQALLRRL